MIATTHRIGKRTSQSIIGTAIPSGAIVAVIGGNTAAGYIGVGGGIYRAPLKSQRHHSPDLETKILRRIEK